MRDYAKTSRRSTANSNRRKAKHARKRRSADDRARILRIGLIVLAVLLTLMLVWSLRALDKVAPDNTDTPSTANTQAGADTTLPKTEKRKPAFSFYEELPKSEENVSDVDAYKQLAAEAPKYRYSLRTGAFKHAEQADKLRAELILMGFAPTIDQRISESGTTWHRVTLGPFPSRSKMYEARGKLLSKNLPAQILKEKAD